MTAYHCVAVKARIESRQSVFVAGGSGGVGSRAIQFLKHFGANPIIATAGGEESANYLVDLGIARKNIVFYRGLSVEKLKESIVEINGGEVDAAFDFVGGAMKHLCFEVVGVNGHVVSIVEESPDFPLNLWDEETSPMVLKAISFHFEQLGAAALRGKKNGSLSTRVKHSQRTGRTRTSERAANYGSRRSDRANCSRRSRGVRTITLER